MSKAFTPGPWGLEGNHLWIMAGHLHVATIPRAGDGDWSQANAHLISAAPDMYEALKALCDWAVDELELEMGRKVSSNEMSRQWHRAKTALAKADGAQ